MSLIFIILYNIRLDRGGYYCRYSTTVPVPPALLMVRMNTTHTSAPNIVVLL